MPPQLFTRKSTIFHKHVGLVVFYLKHYRFFLFLKYHYLFYWISINLHQKCYIFLTQNSLVIYGLNALFLNNCTPPGRILWHLGPKYGDAGFYLEFYIIIMHKLQLLLLLQVDQEKNMHILLTFKVSLGCIWILKNGNKIKLYVKYTPKKQKTKNKNKIQHAFKQQNFFKKANKQTKTPYVEVWPGTIGIQKTWYIFASTLFRGRISFWFTRIKILCNTNSCIYYIIQR